MTIKRYLRALALGPLTACSIGAAHAQGLGAGSVGAAAGGHAGHGSSAVADTSGTTAKSGKQSQKQLLSSALKTITVVGFNKSAETAITYQKYANSIVNVVTAADISGLPDQSIADALTQLPGVAAQRSDGEADQINIDGLDGNFVQTTLDGVVQPSTSGAGYIQFDQYPAELINRVTVYKTSQANLVEGGVGGTIAMETANPLDDSKSQIFNLDVRGSYDPRANDVAGDSPWSERFSAAYRGKFFHNTLGIGLGYAQLGQPHVAEQFVNESYATTTQDINGKPAYVNSGIEVDQSGGSETRRSMMATIVWRPNRHFEMSGTGFYSKYSNEAYQNGIRAQQFDGGFSVITNPRLGPNGALLGATVSSLPNGLFNIPGVQLFSVETVNNNQGTNTSNFTGIFNAKWTQGPWVVAANLSLAHASSYSVGSDVTADAFTGLGTGNPRIALESATFSLNGLNPGSFSVADPSMYTDIHKMALDDYSLYPTYYHDERKALQLNVTRVLDNPIFDSVEAGVYLDDHTYVAERSVYTYGTDYGNNWLLTPTQPPLTLNGSDATQACWSGGGFSSYPCFLRINGAAVMAAHGVTNIKPVQEWSQSWTETESGVVNEKVRDAFVQADIDTTVFHHKLTGNVGLRVSYTSQYSPGLQEVAPGQGIRLVDGNGHVSTDYIRVDPGQTYTHFLPSLNLNYQLNGGNQVRLAVAEVEDRPPINLLKSGVASYELNGTYNLYSGTNPLLDPILATQEDLAFFHFFRHSSGIAGIDLFYKEIQTFPETVTDFNFPFAKEGYTVPIDPQTGHPYADGEYQTAYNAKGGYVRGVALQLEKTRFLPGIFSGLGFSLNYAFTQSGTRIVSDLGGFPQNQALPGLSTDVVSGSLFYDYGPVSTKLAADYRSRFVSASQVSFNFQPVYFAPETVVDYQLAYRFDRHLSGLFQVLNLTDQPTQTYFGNTAETSTIQYFGRTLYAGFSLTL